MVVFYFIAGRATVARQAHNLKIAGSIPASATRNHKSLHTVRVSAFLLYSRNVGVAQLARAWDS